jgi:hypothetical protein
VAKCAGNCGKCKNHCACEVKPIAAVTPPKTRDNIVTKKKIQLSIQTEECTPKKIRVGEGEQKKAAPCKNAQLEKIKGLLPSSKSWMILTQSNLTSAIIESSSRFWRAFVSVVEELVELAAKSVLVRISPSVADPFTKKLKRALIVRFQSDSEDIENNTNGEEQNFIRIQLDLFDKMPPGSDLKRFIRASLSTCYADFELQTLSGRGIPWSKRSSTRGRKDFCSLQDCGEFPDGGVDQSASRCIHEYEQHDEAIKDAVGYIIDNCQMFAHGQKRVPLGDGTTKLLPVLTRLKPSCDLWASYKSRFEAELQPYKAIGGHEGPLRAGSTEYKGSMYNLLIEWTNCQPTMEPMHAIVASDPVAVANYGYKNSMSETKGWVHLQKFWDREVQKKTPKLMTFKGGKKFLERTSFLLLVRVLTMGDEKLVKGLDYVKGVLVHDNVAILQRIIDQHLTDPKQKQQLTKELTILANFLKVQYKDHTKDTDNPADTHGLVRGLQIPSKAFATPHYSCMKKVELSKLVADRGLVGLPSKPNPSQMSRALDFFYWTGHLGDGISSSEGRAKTTDASDREFPKDRESLDALLLTFVELTRKELEERAKKYKIPISSSPRLKKPQYKQALEAALLDKFKQLQGMWRFCACMTFVATMSDLSFYSLLCYFLQLLPVLEMKLLQLLLAVLLVNLVVWRIKRPLSWLKRQPAIMMLRAVSHATIFTGSCSRGFQMISRMLGRKPMVTTTRYPRKASRMPWNSLKRRTAR